MPKMSMTSNTDINVTFSSSTQAFNISNSTSDLNNTELNNSDLELLGPNWQLFLIILYSLTAALSLIGNIIAIWVLIYGKRSSKELRMFLVNLSLSDITMALFSIPFTYTDFMLGRWVFNIKPFIHYQAFTQYQAFYLTKAFISIVDNKIAFLCLLPCLVQVFMPIFCPIVQSMQLVSVFVSVYTLTAIGIDRFVAVMYPLRSSRMTKSLGPVIIAMIWVSGAVLGVVIWVHSVAEEYTWGDETYHDCKETWSPEAGRIYTLVIFSITFALPMTILIYVYGCISCKMYTHSVPGNADPARDEAQHNAKLKVIKMLATIVLLFALCWLPIHAINLALAFARDWLHKIYETEFGYNTYVAFTFSAHWISMANSFVNPIIYCFMSDNFRLDLRLLISMVCFGRNASNLNELRGSTWSGASTRNKNNMNNNMMRLSTRQNRINEYDKGKDDKGNNHKRKDDKERDSLCSPPTNSPLVAINCNGKSNCNDKDDDNYKSSESKTLITVTTTI